MKKKIHPKYNENIKVTCSCGAVFTIGSTQAEIKTEVCSACHPFYTGKQKLIDTAGRVDKFKAQEKKAAAGGASKKKVKVLPKIASEVVKGKKPSSRNISKVIAMLQLDDDDKRGKKKKEEKLEKKGGEKVEKKEEKKEKK